MKKHILIGTVIWVMAVFSMSGCGSAESDDVQTVQSVEETQSTKIELNIETTQTAETELNIETTRSVETVQHTETTAHVHKEQGVWEKNGTEHWMSCACEENIAIGEHELDDEWICKICGSEILDFGDIDVSEYDEYGNVLSRRTFSVDGELLSETSYEREYDEQGNILTEKYFDNGVLREEDTYYSDENGALSLASATYYYEDGSKQIEEYNEDGDILARNRYAADGTLEFTEVFNYENRN